MGGASAVDGKDLVRRYLDDVFSGGNVDAIGLLKQLGVLSDEGISKGLHSALAPSRRARD